MLMTGPEREVVGLRWDWWRVFGWERVRVVREKKEERGDTG
jgi:hypothetical protein